MTKSPSKRELTVFGVTFRDCTQLGKCIGRKAFRRRYATEEYLRRAFFCGLSDRDIAALLKANLKKLTMTEVKKRFGEAV